jgi:hypothetical protein
VASPSVVCVWIALDQSGQNWCHLFQSLISIWQEVFIYEAHWPFRFHSFGVLWMWLWISSDARSRRALHKQVLTEIFIFHGFACPCPWINRDISK